MRACKTASSPEESSGAVTPYRIAGSADGKASGVARAIEKVGNGDYRVVTPVKPETEVVANRKQSEARRCGKEERT